MTGLKKAPIGLALVIVFTAGCMSVDEGGDESGEPSSPWSFRGVDLAGTPHPVHSNESWSELRIEARGQPGTWMVAYREFSSPGDASSYTVHVEAEASGNGSEPLALYVIPPQVMHGADGPVLAVVDVAELLVDLEGRALSYGMSQEHGWSVLAGPGFSGIFAVVGSTGHWSAEITVHLGHGSNSTGPSFVAVNEGVSLSYGGIQQMGQSDGQVGRVILEKELRSAGLVHFEYFSKPMFHGIYHRYIHDCELHWGDHQHRDCSGRGSTRGDGTRIGAWGGFNSEPGRASLDIMYVETTYGLDLAILHLPGERTTMFPESLQGFGYILWKPYWGSGGGSSIGDASSSDRVPVVGGDPTHDWLG